MGIPFNMGGVPILNTLFLYSDMKRVIEDGNTSNWDQETAAMGIVSLLAGIILRTPGFAQVEQIQRSLWTRAEMLCASSLPSGVTPNTTPRAALSGWRSGPWACSPMT